MIVRDSNSRWLALATIANEYNLVQSRVHDVLVVDILVRDKDIIQPQSPSLNFNKESEQSRDLSLHHNIASMSEIRHCPDV